MYFFSKAQRQDYNQMTRNRVSWNTFLHSNEEKDNQAEKFGAVTKVEKKKKEN